MVVVHSLSIYLFFTHGMMKSIYGSVTERRGSSVIGALELSFSLVNVIEDQHEIGRGSAVEDENLMSIWIWGKV